MNSKAIRKALEVLCVSARFVGTMRAMAWTKTDGLVDLKSRAPSGQVTLVFATDVNDARMITGAAVSADLVTQGFLLEALP